MFLLKGKAVGDEILVDMVYNMLHPDSKYFNTEGGVLVDMVLTDTLDAPPMGYGYELYVNSEGVQRTSLIEVPLTLEQRLLRQEETIAAMTRILVENDLM